jgi:hypothetical protein
MDQTLDRWVRLFREHRLQFGVDGRVRTWVLSPSLQAAAAAAVVLGLTATAGFAAGAGLTAATRPSPPPATLRGPLPLGATPAADPATLALLARTVQQRDAALEALLHSLAANPAGVAAGVPGAPSLAGPAGAPDRRRL